MSEGSQLKPQKSEINQKKFPEEFWQFPRRNLRKPRKLSPKFELQWMYSNISQRVFLPVHITSYAIDLRKHSKFPIADNLKLIKIYNTKSLLGALRAGFWPFGPAWLRPSPTQQCIRLWEILKNHGEIQKRDIFLIFLQTTLKWQSSHPAIQKAESKARIQWFFNDLLLQKFICFDVGGNYVRTDNLQIM